MQSSHASRLPKESAPQFAAFFAELDEYKDGLGIDSYGVALTTLEEVFLRIGLEDKIERDEEYAKDEDEQKELTSLGKDKEKIAVALAYETQGHRFMQQLRALLVKRALGYRRDIRGLFFTLFLPFAFIVLSAAVISSTSTFVSLVGRCRFVV